MTSTGNSVSATYDQIVTHDDFDGIVSASLCSWALKIQKVIFAGPLTVARAQIPITEKDVVCDLPFPLQCGLWFDHHEGNLHELSLRKIDIKSVQGRFDLKPSCSRVVYEYFSGKEALPEYLLKAVEEADVIDSFAFDSIEDWRRETPGKVIELTLKTQFPSGKDQSDYMRNLVYQLRDHSIEDVSRLEMVQTRLKQYREEEERMLRVIREASLFFGQDEKKEMVVIDLTRYQRRPHLVRNLAFLIYPEALGVLEVYNLLDHKGVKSNHLGFSMSLSIRGNRKEKAKNIGEIMRSLNIGDGHPGAAAGTMQCDSKKEMLKKKEEIMGQIFKIWSSQ